MKYISKINGNAKFKACLHILLAAVLPMLAALVPAAPAQADDIYSDNFDSYANGTLLNTSPGGWVQVYEGAGNAAQHVDNTRAVSGTQSMLLTGSGYSAGAYHAVSLPSKFSYEAMIYSSGSAGQYNGWFALGDATMVTAWYGGVAFHPDGYICSDTGGSWTHLMPYTPGEWYKVKVYMDLIPRTFDVYINGTLRGSNIPIGYAGTPTGIILESGNADVQVWFDDVRVYTEAAFAESPYAWGSNEQGGLGDNTITNRNVPVRVHGVGNSGYLSGVTAIAGGYNHSLAVKSDGTAWAWGWNGYGQLGDGTLSGSYTPIQVKDPGGTAPLTGIIAVDARGERDGGVHSLALKSSDGTVYAWGSNTYGQLGNGTNMDNPLPVQVSGLTGVTAIAAGRAHSLALKADGTVWVWGYNGYGQLGDSTNSDNNTPVQVHGVGDSGYLTNIIAIAAGYYHSLAVKSDGTVYAWGLGTSGELGNATYESSSTPVQVSGLTGARAVAGGGDRVSGRHSLAVKTDGTVWSWGFNGYGQLGDNTINISNIPVQVHGPSDSGFLSGVKSVAAGAWHSVALKTDGTVWAWGSGGWGQLGNSTWSNSYTPVQVADISNAVAVSAGALDSLALIGPAPVEPTVTNASGATSVMATTAILHGNLISDGGAATTVTIYGGTIDAGRGSWEHVYNLGARTPGAFSLGITGLSPGTPYYYRCSATNDAGTSWAEPSLPFTTQQPLGLWRNYWAGPGKDWHWFSSGGP